MMTVQARNKRRALIIRRQTVYSGRRVPRKIAHPFRDGRGVDPDESESTGAEGDVLADLPDMLD